MKSFFWHDYETFGIDPKRDFPVQFAGVRTDYEFNIIAEPVNFYCRPAADCLPHPEACLITGITPQIANKNGVCEAEFIGLIHQQLMQANTCSVGYNSLRFDDEVTRNALYRNFYDPYAREYQHGNSRWDIIDMLRATYALRPDGINWVYDEAGNPRFKLEKLTQANDIAHEAAHDALSDVYATIAMAKLIRQQQPKLYEFLFVNRGKQQVTQLLQLGKYKPLIHVSGMFAARNNCLAIVLPICQHPTNKNEVIVYDLSQDPSALLNLDAEAIRQRLFAASADLPIGVERIALKTVHINKCPVLAPLQVLRPADIQRLEINLGQCLEHVETIKKSLPLANKLAEVFNSNNFVPETDPDLMLYSGGFFQRHDKAIMEAIRQASVADLAELKPKFVDARLDEMLFRYKARNYPQILSVTEQQRWQEFCHNHLNNNTNIDLKEYFRRIQILKNEPNAKLEILADLEEYGLQLQGS